MSVFNISVFKKLKPQDSNLKPKVTRKKNAISHCILVICDLLFFSWNLRFEAWSLRLFIIMPILRTDTNYNVSIKYKVQKICTFIFDKISMAQLKNTFFLICVFQIISCNLYAQKAELIQVKGIVVNKKLETIPFTTILVKNKNFGTISDENGKFDFFTEKGDTIQFSCVGYKKSKFLVPTVSNYRIYYFLAMLQHDTILLPEVIIIPWKTYKEFVQAFVKTKIPDTDIDRAEKNLALIQLQMLINDDDMPSAPGASYNLLSQQRNSLLYWKGQTQPMQIFNVFAWQQFFDYLKNGKFKRKQSNE